MITFESLGLTAPVLEALNAEGYTTPTPIQEKAVPHVLAGRDLFGCAQTGTGKTAAFALPLIERMLANPQQPGPRRCRVLVLAPTRELAGQIYDSFKAYGRNAKIKCAVIYGGVNQRPQGTAMMRGVDVLVATPGRLLDLVNQRLVDLRSVEYLVLDEADRMLDMGFIHDVRRIVAMLPKERQTLFFSATLPAEVRELANSMLRDPLEVKTTPQATSAETVAQSVFLIPQKQKRSLLVHLLKTEGMSRVIVFTRTKHGADKLQRDLEKSGITAAAIHGNKSQNQRERALAAFKSQRPPVLIATDIAARGIDVEALSHVINFDIPPTHEDYIHRVGRTGRNQSQGDAFAFVSPEEEGALRAIERAIGSRMPRITLPDFDYAAQRTNAPEAARFRGGREGSGRGRSSSPKPYNRFGAQRGGAAGSSDRGGTDRFAQAAATNARQALRGAEATRSVGGGFNRTRSQGGGAGRKPFPRRGGSR